MKPWLAQYDSDVAPSIAPYPEKTLPDYLSALAREAGDRTALLFKGTEMSYAELDALSQAFGAALVSLGIGRGDRVALLLPNTPQFLIAQFGIWKAGAIAAPLNPLYSERELEEALVASGASLIVTLTPFYRRVKNIQARTRVRRIVATSIKEYLPRVLAVLFTLFKEKKEGHRIELEPGDVWFADLVRDYRKAPPPAVTISPDDYAVILSSGGTTGTPKGVVGRHRDYIAAGCQLHAWTKSMLSKWTDVIMLPLPLFHVYANVGVLPLAVVASAPLSLVPNPRDTGDLLRTIRKVRPAFFNGIPALYIAILNHPDVRAGKVDLRSIKLCFCGASALLAETKRQFEAATGARIVEGYSLTEAMMACCLNPVAGTNKIGSIGVPLPDITARIVDAENGERTLPSGEVGELILQSPQHMAEYWNNPAETAATLRSHGEGPPWVHTGDLAYMDDEGYIFLVDRKKDMLKTSGFQVWPREIEEVLAAHPAVQEASVAGVPDPTKGEVPKAWIVLKAGHHASEDELRAHCREKLAPYKVPASVEFRQDLPKSMVGKVLRRVLVQETKSAQSR